LSPWNLHCRVEGPARMCLVLWMVIVRVRLLRVNGERYPSMLTNILSSSSSHEPETNPSELGK
jgi:hypothetical protein